jgi:hypothetical protein
MSPTQKIRNAAFFKEGKILEGNRSHPCKCNNIDANRKTIYDHLLKNLTKNLQTNQKEVPSAQ